MFAPLLLGVIDGLFYLQEQQAHLFCPKRSLLFKESGQLTQMMGVAEGVPTRIPLVTGVAVMHRTPKKGRQYATGVHPDLAALLVPRVVTQARRRSTMQPMQTPTDPKTGLVEVSDRLLL